MKNWVSWAAVSCKVKPPAGPITPATVSARIKDASCSGAKRWPVPMVSVMAADAAQGAAAEDGMDGVDGTGNSGFAT